MQFTNCPGFFEIGVTTFRAIFDTIVYEHVFQTYFPTPEESDVYDVQTTAPGFPYSENNPAHVHGGDALATQEWEAWLLSFCALEEYSVSPELNQSSDWRKTITVIEQTPVTKWRVDTFGHIYTSFFTSELPEAHPSALWGVVPLSVAGLLAALVCSVGNTGDSIQTGSLAARRRGKNVRAIVY